MERKNVVLLTVIAVATLLTAMVGSTFAYFTATIKNRTNPDGTVYKATAATVEATYSDGAAINVTNLEPGKEAGSKTIEITNKGTSGVPIDYEISFASYTNGFGNLQYKLEGITEGTQNSSETANIQGTTSNFTTMLTSTLKSSSNTLVTGHLGAGETHKFKLTIQLPNLSSDQTSADANKTFSGKLQATAKAVAPSA